MNTEDFEHLVEGAVETPGLDFKRACPCDIDSLVKDILAMSNVSDGGHIVVGIDQKPFRRDGVSAEFLATYDEDTMRDRVRAYANPRVSFNVLFPTGGDGLRYVVIRVAEFTEVPVICARDGKEVRAGAIYYRNRDRRVESAAISNAHDLRDVLTRAAVKMMRGFREIGLHADDSVSKRLDAELGGL